MFSASLPPAVIATVLAGLDVLEREPGILDSLRENIAYAASGFQDLGFDVHPAAAIIPLLVPAWMNIRQAARKLHVRGVFVNSVEYPAVPLSQQRFRISIMATHTTADIDALLSAVQHVWSECTIEAGQASRPSTKFAA
jgi:glycine C-acetyltransferase